MYFSGLKPVGDPKVGEKLWNSGHISCKSQEQSKNPRVETSTDSNSAAKGREAKKGLF